MGPDPSTARGQQRFAASVPATPIPQVSAGAFYTCALKSDGTVTCWGRSFSGETAVPDDLNAVARISTGNQSACALRISGTVVCWGYNGSGQTSVPNGLTSVTQVSAGTNHMCAVKTDGTVVCWGWNADGQATVPSGLTGVKQVSAGFYHTCAVKTDGNVVCWGNNSYGQATKPVGLTAVVQVSVGTYYTCALKTDGTVTCWGINGTGPAPVPATLGMVAQVNAGPEHVCATKTDGTVVCWGRNDVGQATPPADLNAVAQVTAGGLHSCALRTDGTAVCWGHNGYGQSNVPTGLNLGASMPSTSTPQVSAAIQHTCALKADGTVVCWGQNDVGQATVPAGLTAVTQMTAAYQHDCAVKSDGTVVCWGDNSHGEATVPTGLAPVTQVTAGIWYSCARKADGTVVCWGINQYGQTAVPAGLASASQVSAGFYHACAVKTDGTAVCWGYDDNGRTAVPTGLASVAQVSAGGFHTCAAKTDGTVSCWGGNDAYVGAGIQRGQANVPAGLVSVIQITSGGYHTCVLKTDRTVVCWGDNSNGQSDVPTGLGSVAQVSAGNLHTCATKTDGTVICWGRNIEGQAAVPDGLVPGPPPGLVSHWPAEGNANDVEDGNDGALRNGATFAAGRVGQAFLLDGVAAYVDVGNAPNLHVSRGDFTIGAWVRFNSLSGGGFGDMSIVDKMAETGLTQTTVNTDGWRLIKQSDNRFWFCFGGGASNQCGNPTHTIFSSTSAVTGVWYHVAVVKSSSSFSLYINGVLEDTRSPVPVFRDNDTTNLRLGALPQHGAYLNGFIDEAEIHNRALSAAEIAAIYDAAPRPQAISFTSTPPVSAIVGGSYQVTATGGGSNNQVSVTSLTPTTCTVDAARVAHLIAIGECRIAADQAGGGGYAAAPQISQSFTIASSAQLVTFTSTPPTPVATSSTYLVAATGGLSGNPVTFSSFTPSVCTVTGNNVSFVTLGLCVIAGNQAAGNGYTGAPTATQSVTVSVVGQPIPNISAGGFHTCALRVDGTVGCWGLTDHGQAFVPLGLGSVVQVAAGGLHTCALRAARTAVCWGANDFGQATPPGGLASVAQLSSGQYHTCALKTDGTVVCWGYNSNGQSNVPGGLTAIAQVSAGSFHTCALRTNGTVLCWGNDNNGQSTVPAGLSSVTKITSGQFHTCALRSGGIVSCWGLNSEGQATVPGGLTSVAKLAAGGSHTCAVRTNGSTTCWGQNVYGQTTVPSTLVSVSEVSAGLFHTCALKTDATMACWGHNQYGQTIVPAGLNLNDAAQVISFTSTPPSPALVHGSYTVAATGGASGNPVTFSSFANSVCTVNGNTVSFLLNGNCAIAANQAGGNGYDAATPVVQSFTVASSGQFIQFTSTPPSPALTGGTYTVVANGGPSGNPVTFSAQTPSICTVGGSSVSFIAVGVCRIAANQTAGNGYDAAGQTLQSFTIGSPAQSITFTSTPPSPAFPDAAGTYAVTATGGASGSPVLFSSLTASTCSVNGSSVFLLAAGTCTVTADQSAANGYDAAPQVTQSFVITSPAQTIAFTSTPPVPALSGGTYTVAAVGGASGNPVTFTSLTPSTCALDAAHVAHFALAGTCQLVADQAGGNRYTAAPRMTQVFTVVLSSQFIAFTTTPPSPAPIGERYTVAATGGASGNPVTFSSLTDGICTVSGSIVSFISVGSCAVAANQAGGAGGMYYDPALQQTQTFAVSKATQAALIVNAQTLFFYGSTQDLTTSGGSGTGAVTYAVVSGPCAVSGFNLGTSSGTGSCTLTATKAGDANYNPVTSAPVTVTLAKGTQLIAFAQPASPATFGTTFSVAPTSSFGSIFEVLVAASGGCSISGGTVTMTSGTTRCTLTASHPGDDRISTAPEVVRIVDAARATASVLMVNAGTPLTFNQTETLTSTGGSGAVSYASSANCSVSGVSLTANSGTGICVVTATSAANDNYAATSTAVTVTLQKASSSVAVVCPVTSQTYTGSPQTPCTASYSGAGGLSGALTPTYSNNTSVGTAGASASYAGDTDHIGSTDDGSFTISAAQATATAVDGGGVFNGSAYIGTGTCANGLIPNVTYSGGSAPINQGTTGFTVTCGDDGNNYVDGSAAGSIVIAPASSSVTVTCPTTAQPYTGLAQTPCTASYQGAGGLSGTLAPSYTGNTNAGRPVASASYDGDANHLGSSNASSFTIVPLAQAISFTSNPPRPALNGGSYTVTASGGGSGIPLVFTSDTPRFCSVSQGVVSLLDVGDCVIVAEQDGSENYLPALRVTQTFAVSSSAQSIAFSSTPVSPAVAGTTYTVSATGGASGNAVTFSSLTSSVCTVTGSGVQFLVAGDCRVAADQAPGGGYVAASQSVQDIPVFGTQTISFISPAPQPAYTLTSYDISAVGGASVSPVTFSSLSSSVCTVTGSAVYFQTSGQCLVAADQAGGRDAAGSNYLPALRVVLAIDVSAKQRITITSAPPSPALSGATYVVTATGGASGNPVSYASLSTRNCTVSGSLVTFGPSDGGQCTLAANQAGGGGYIAADQVTQVIDVYSTQAIVFTSTPPSPALIGDTYNVAAKGGSSGSPVVFTSITPGACTLNSGRVTLVATSSCTIVARQAGTGVYLAAPDVSQTFNVVAEQTVAITSPAPKKALVGNTYVVTATGGASGQPIVFTSQTPSVCAMVDARTARMVGTGGCTIAANQAGNTAFLPGVEVTQKFNVK